MFLERLDAESFEGATVLDVGTGEGRLALLLAGRAGRVVGIDVDEDRLEAARARAAGHENITFVNADAEAGGYIRILGGRADVVVASYYMTRTFVQEAAKALAPGGRFLFACHHTDQWREGGIRGRFAFGEEEMRGILAEAGLAVRFLGVDRTVITYDDLGQLAEAHPHLHRKFTADGRWAALERRYGYGEAVLTWSTMVGVADLDSP